MVLFFYLCLDYSDPYHSHNKLKYGIKLALKPSGRADPAVHIEIPFDYYMFMGGMRRAGTMKWKSHSYEVYGIDSYNALVPILGERWHVRILNEDRLLYVVHSTVKYYLYHCTPLIDSWAPSCSWWWLLSYFRLVCGDGVQSTLDSITSML